MPSSPDRRPSQAISSFRGSPTARPALTDDGVGLGWGRFWVAVTNLWLLAQQLLLINKFKFFCYVKNLGILWSDYSPFVVRVGETTISLCV